MSNYIISKLFPKKTYEVELFVMSDDKICTKFNVTVTARTAGQAEKLVMSKLALRVNRSFIYKKRA